MRHKLAEKMEGYFAFCLICIYVVLIEIRL
jgi:hypothetical protein